MRYRQIVAEASTPVIKLISADDDALVTFFAYVGRAKVGHLQINMFDDRMPDARHVEKVYVDPDFQRQGIGGKLYDAAEAYLGERGLRLVPSTRYALSGSAADLWAKRTGKRPDSTPYESRTVQEARETVGAALREGRDAPLYHGTHLAAALEILKNDTIEARSSHETSRIAALGGQPSLGQTTEAIRGVSLTRSRDQALHFEFGEIVFELDQRRLSQTHKLIPFDYWGAGHLNEPSGRGHHLPHTDKNEAEEFCVGVIKPASRYITAIYMSRRRYGYNTKHYPLEVLRPLLDHPLLQIV